MATSPGADLVRALARVTLLNPAQLREVESLQQRQASPQALAHALVQRGWLTVYQAQRLLRGQTAELLLGQYVILERLGEGGMGQVFKARHTRLNRLAAIKVLRRELVSDTTVVQRFLREIAVSSQLSAHPNVVDAFDAGPIGGTYFLAMEYIDGIDLGRLVKQSGYLTVDHACSYIRQAALGLQHAHAHGLVHRDIKPANLMVTPQPQGKDAPCGTVKILDLGLARLHRQGAAADQAAAALTSDGSVTMGTIDYLAPEQALDFHAADIRADIYSLGCTFYFLLTGDPPFGPGPLTAKLMRHQQIEPPDLRTLRPEVPAALLPIVRRMLAKKPDDRFQTPGEVAQALANVPTGGEPAVAVPSTRSSWLAVPRWLAMSVWQRPRLRRMVAGVAGVLLAALLLWGAFAGREHAAVDKTAPPTARENTEAVVIDFSKEFTTGSLVPVGNAVVTNHRLRLTDTANSQRSAAWYNQKVNVTKFRTTFDFQLTQAAADGFSFCVQNTGGNALGGSGGAFGYDGIGHSVAVVFHLYHPLRNHTSIYLNGLANGRHAPCRKVDLGGGQVLQAEVVYEERNLKLTVTNKTSGVSDAFSWPVDIPSVVGGPTAWVGFTGATGGATARQEIISWTFWSRP